MFEILLDAEVFAPEPLGRVNVAVCAGKVVWIGTEAPAIPESLVSGRLDLGGRRLIPGLIDAHVHITGGGGESGASSRVPAPVLSRYTAAGVTSVVGLLGTDDTTRSTAGLLATARGLAEEGLNAWCYTGGYHLPPATLTGSVRGDIVHLDRVIGAGEIAISDHRSSQPTLDQLLRLASETHVAGLLTGKAGIVHLHLGDGPRGLDLVRRALETSEIPPRVFNPTHVNRRRALFEEALELAAAGSTIDLTAFPVTEGEDAWSAAEALGRYLDAVRGSGLPRERITVSSDAGGCLACFDADGRVEAMEVCRPGALVTTLSSLVAAGRPLEEVLPAFTSNVARLLRLPGKGRVAVGGDADLVALDGGGVSEVMIGGRWFVREGEAEIRGRFETAREKPQGTGVV